MITVNYIVYETMLLVFQRKSYVVESPYGCFVVHPGSGLNYAQDLGMGEIQNVLDKPSVEPHNKIRVVGEPAMHILKITGREGVVRGIVEQRRGHFLVLGVQETWMLGHIDLMKVSLVLWMSLAVLSVHFLSSLINEKEIDLDDNL